MNVQNGDGTFPVVQAAVVVSSRNEAVVLERERDEGGEHSGEKPAGPGD